MLPFLTSLASVLAETTRVVVRLLTGALVALALLAVFFDLAFAFGLAFY